MPRLLPRGGLDGPRSTRSGGGGGGRSGGRGRGRPAVKPAAKDDDDICVVEEKLTPLAKMKAKVSWILYRRNKTGREGTLGCLLHWSPNFYNNNFLFADFWDF